MSALKSSTLHRFSKDSYSLQHAPVLLILFENGLRLWMLPSLNPLEYRGGKVQKKLFIYYVLIKIPKNYKVLVKMTELQCLNKCNWLLSTPA